MKSDSTQIPEVIDNFRRILQVVAEYSRDAEHATGLTGPQLWVLKILASSSPMRVSDLARQMYLSPATVVGIIDRLEAKGVVTRTRSKLDRRAVEIQLSQAGVELAAKAPEVAQLMLVQGLNELTAEQFACVEEGMRQVARLLGAERVTPQPLHG